MPYWVAHLQSGRFRLALACLQERGYSAYYPMLAGPKVGGRRSSVVGLFVNYCFVAARSDGHWWDAGHAPGVVRLVGRDRGRGAPVMLDDTEVDMIRKREGRDGLVRLPRPRGLQPGDKVKILRGPFEGRIATLHSAMNGHQRVAVLLAVLGGERRAELPRDAVRAV